ncbi:DUF3515 domain-containing protein [Nocardia bovistercoris]|uniref:DUF3515 family protein n=1 Tax=Nocardia bovistercoris TaxID=2785916 RepID=A0A931N1Y7_9NOCA|nr:DUF3515 domain-containing protein [Nocardia bovistercoris]MBH0775446.1 DUF3515 family protein [Nocardia bovistercoris]
MAADTSDSDPKTTDPTPAEDSGRPANTSSAAATSEDEPTTDRAGSEGESNAESDAGETDAADSDAEPDAGESADAEPASRLSSYPPALIATAVALPVVLIVGLVVAALVGRDLRTEREPLALGPVPAPAAAGPACTTLLPALPSDLGDYTKSQLVEPAPPATRAWQRPDGGDAIVLRCGLDRPLEFHRASPLQLVDTVQWFEVRDPAATASTWFAVDRETYIALTVPDGSGPTPLQEVSDTIVANLPQRPLDPGPLPN